ncbi:Putative glycoside hydrolase superfamily [Septoria linicola]|uniref:glucan endo-1,3-beta-D-glucosidase n=1 Tax=Septoria linicola TaxID=215465 RepID=A0A9Q9EN94_9PEZI|nr:Putative glycoside hydrolase superfamily [Septoria linicola]
MLSSTLSLLALAGSAAAQVRGFNYGALYADNRARQLADWEADFRAAQNLPGVGGFTSARLFTMIQGYSDNEVISALPAAVSTNTSLLLGLWCSAGQDAFNQELAALRTAIQQYGDQLADSIIGISIGSEDLYRISPTGIENESGPGAEPQQLVSYIQQAREVLQGTVWADKQIGHVDTWTAYVNGSNNAVVEALDWVGVDAYPYFQTVNENSIENAEGLFFDAYNATVGAAQGKPVWVAETGWPVTGPQSGLATSGTENAETYWKDVACRLLGNVNTWWYQLNDGADQEVSFKIIGADRGAPLYDLSCPANNGDDSNDRATSTSSGSSSATAVTVSGSVIPVPTGTPSPRPSSPAGGYGGNSTTTPDTDTPNDNNQNAGPVASQPAGNNGTAQRASGSSGAPVASGPTATATSSNPAQYTGAAVANAPALGLLIVGAIMVAL